MSRGVGRAIAVAVIVVAGIWLVPLILMITVTVRERPVIPSSVDLALAVVMTAFWATPAVIAIWRASRYLKENPRRRPPVQRRGFSVLPPR